MLHLDDAALGALPSTWYDSAAVNALLDAMEAEHTARGARGDRERGRAVTKTPMGTTGHLTVVEGWGAHHPMMCDFFLHTAVYVYGVLGCKDFNVRRTSCVAQEGPIAASR